MVVRRTASAAFVVPCVDILLEDFTSKKKQLNEIDQALIFQVDIANLKFKKELTLLTSNRANKSYMRFLQGHKMPENLYFFSSKFGSEISNFSDLLRRDISQKNAIEEVMPKQVSLVQVNPRNLRDI